MPVPIAAIRGKVANKKSELCRIDFNHNPSTPFGFSFLTDTLGYLSVNSSAALSGSSYGLLITIPGGGTTLGYGEFTVSPVSTTGILRVKLAFDPNSLTMGAGDSFKFFEAFTSGGNTVLGLKLLYSGGYKLLGYVADDAATEQNTAQIALTDAPHLIEADFVKDASAGRVDVWVDGAGPTSKTSVANNTRWTNIAKLRFGVAYGLDIGTSGPFFLDEIIANTTGEEIDT